VLLLVAVRSAEGDQRPMMEGPVIPAWGGDLAGEPGLGYAKILRDARTGESPVVSYWTQTVIESDNRIPALERDERQFLFKGSKGEMTVEVRLIFRRLFQPLADRYGWVVPDILLASQRIVIERAP
jgi:hypothetical protein